MATAGAHGRNELIDALKCLGIAMVVLTHLLNLRGEFRMLPGASATVRAMLAFNMPLFTLLSGYVLFGREGRHPLRFVRDKALGLLVPYLAWIAVVMPVRRLAPVDWLPRLGSALIDPHRGFQMWFLWVLFVLMVVFTLARLVSKADWWTGGVAVASAIALAFVKTSAFGVDKILWLYPFLIGGYMLAKYRDRLRRLDVPVAFAGVVAFPLLVWLNSPMVPLRFATGIAGVTAAWAIYRLLPEAMLTPQAWVGQRTLGIYGAQMLVLPYLMVGNGWWGVAASEATVMGGSTLLAWVLERWSVTRAIFLGQWPRRKREDATIGLDRDPLGEPDASTPDIEGRE